MRSTTITQNVINKREMTMDKSKTINIKGKLPSEIGTDYTFKRKIVWFNVIGFLILHLGALFGVYLVFFYTTWKTIFYSLFLTMLCGQGITMGAHRLFAHKAFKATFIVKLGLIILQTMSGQNCLYIWARDHRLHHKYSDTDADPHNSNRGFFFSHMGWLLSKKHPAVICKGKTLDMSDLESDPLIMFQKKYYKSLYLIFALCIPIAIPIYLWNETYISSFFVTYLLRYMVSLHCTWLVNSAAHMYGNKPYDVTMSPVQSWFVSFLTSGEGWHNYHHAFPWDYRASELGTKLNITTIIIDIFATLGLVYDLKSTPENMVKHRCLKKGDGSHPKYIALKKGQNKNEEEALMPECDCFQKHEESVDNHTNSEIEENENKVKEIESIFIKDATGEEKTVIKRIVKDKHLLHG